MALRFLSTAIRIFFYVEYAVNSITSVNTMLVGVVNRFAFISTEVMLPAAITGQLK
jgi:hypothetical protein